MERVWPLRPEVYDFLGCIAAAETFWQTLYVQARPQELTQPPAPHTRGRVLYVTYFDKYTWYTTTRKPEMVLHAYYVCLKKTGIFSLRGWGR